MAAISTMPEVSGNPFSQPLSTCLSWVSKVDIYDEATLLFIIIEANAQYILEMFADKAKE